MILTRARDLLGLCLLVLLLVGVAAVTACTPKVTLPKLPVALFAPGHGTAKSFETTTETYGLADIAKGKQRFTSTLAMHLRQSIYPMEPTGLRLIRFVASDVRIISGGQRLETTQTFSHQAKVDPLGRTVAVLEVGPGGKSQPVGRQSNIEAVFDYVQPIYTKGRPTVGLTWETTRSVPILQNADMRFRFRYKVLGEEVRGARKLFKIKVDFTSNDRTVEKQHYTRTVASGTHKGGGTILVDELDLQTVEAVMSWHSSMDFRSYQLNKTASSHVVADSKLTWREITP